MNCLIVDDINLVGISIEKRLLSLGYDAKEVNFYHYKIDKNLSTNTKNIFELLVNNNIEFLVLDRGFSKIIEEDEFIYSSQLESDNKKKLQCDRLLFGRSNNGLIDIITKNNYILKNILIYTYDPFTPKIIEVLKKLKKDIKKKLPKTNIYTIETSTVFRKPKNLELYPENFTSHPNNDKYNLTENKRSIISTKKVFVEYSHLISDLIDDIVKLKNKQITSYTNSKNLDFEEFVVNFNNLNLSSFKLASVAFLHKDNTNEDYLLDFPYRSYYQELNEKIKNKKYLNLFVDEDGKDLLDKWIYYDYNFTNKEFKIHNLISNNIRNKGFIKKWLPLLNSSIFHENVAWDIEKINKSEKINAELHSIKLVFYFTSINTLYTKGHINLTFFEESTSHYPESYIKSSIIPRIKQGLQLIVTKSTEYIIPKFTEQILQQSTRAAISQVMARNMSHNIGSHVMSRLITEDKLLEITNIKDSDGLFELLQNYSGLKDTLEHNKDVNLGITLLANLNSYQKTRMDFLADITFGEATLESTKSFFSELLNNLDNNRLLLNFISGTDNFKYEFICRNLIDCLESCTEKINIDNDCDKCIIKLNSDNDVKVSIPNDILGYHAFYIILENIVRNIAKHGKRNDKNETVKIYIDIKENKRTEDYYEINIYDNSKLKEIDLNILVKEQNESINKDVIDNGKLRQGGWGLIEMDASSAYLRKCSIDLINHEDYDVDCVNNDSIFPQNSTSKSEPNFFKAINIRNKHYGYRMFLFKPKEAIYVFSKEFYINQSYNTIPKELRKIGVKVVVIDGNHDNFNEDELYAYPILIFAGTVNDYNTKIAPNTNALPNRQLLYIINDVNNDIVSSRFSHKLNKNDIDFINLDKSDLINKIWKSWILKQNEYLGVKIASGFKRGSFAKENCLDLDYFTNDNFDSNFIVSIDDHAIENINTILCDDNDNNNYAEPYNSKDYFILRKIIKNNKKGFQKLLDPKDFSLFCKLIESTTSIIHVLDERIQELSEKTYYYPENKGADEKLLYTDVLYATHVIIPLSGILEPNGSMRKCKAKINLNDSDYNSTYKKIIEYIQSVFRTRDDKKIQKNKADFLLIHLGIIEKLIACYRADKINDWKYDKDDIGVKRFIEDVLMNNNKKDIETKIIIISGRGRPHNLPKNYLYLNFSLVSQYCIENRLKYLLNDVVFSAKQIKI